MAGALAWAAGPALAQTTTCKTSNCTVGKDGGGNPISPAACQNRAAPRLLRVTMDSATLRFIPSSIRVEGDSTTPGILANYQCIEWRKVGSSAVPWHSATDVTTGSSCLIDTTCAGTNTTPPCDFETGNIDNNTMATNLEYSVCHYRNVAPAAYPFRCRLHFTLGMTGSLTVVAPIDLRVNKGPAGEAQLEWAMGGVGPWDVWRDMTAPMPAATNLAPAGTPLRSFTDAAPVAAGAAFYYLVGERN